LDHVGNPADHWGCYCEWFTLIPHFASLARPENYANGGFRFLLSDNVQWDIRAGFGLNEAADNFFAGSGL
jgi:hypothetical protein